MNNANRVVARLPSILDEAGLTDLVEIEVMADPGHHFEDLSWMRDTGDVVWVEQITSIVRRNGHGRAGMAELCILADGEECRLALNPWAQDYPDALRQDELEAFYASLGFRWRRDHVMVREVGADTVVHVQRDVPWQPAPNRCETILSSARPPDDLTATAFAYPVVEDGRVLLSSSLKPDRDLEPAGGHIEPGEDQDDAVLRESVEEIGASLVGLVPIGHQRLTSGAPRPDGWRYPFPISYQSFFAARIGELSERTAPEECGPPRSRKVRDIVHPPHRLLAMRALQVA